MCLSHRDCVTELGGGSSSVHLLTSPPTTGFGTMSREGIPVVGAHRLARPYTSGTHRTVVSVWPRYRWSQLEVDSHPPILIVDHRELVPSPARVRCLVLFFWFFLLYSSSCTELSSSTIAIEQRRRDPVLVLASTIQVKAASLSYPSYPQLQCLAFSPLEPHGFREVVPLVVDAPTGTNFNTDGEGFPAFLPQ